MNLGIFHKNLILSPDYSRQKLTEFIESASDTIDFYFPYITDEDFQNKLFYLAQKGISIRGIVGKEFYKDNSDIIEIYAKNNIELRPINTDKLHAKMILIDKQKAYVGSINFSTFSFDENREVGVLLQEEKIIQQLYNQFLLDL